jgi:hypothetical protein
VEHALNDSIMDDGTPIVKVRNFRSALDSILRASDRISQKRKFVFANGKIACSESTVGALFIEFSLLKPGISVDVLRNVINGAPPAFTGYLELKATKKGHIKKLLESVYVPLEKTFYQSLNLESEEEPESVPGFVDLDEEIALALVPLPQNDDSDLDSNITALSLLSL